MIAQAVDILILSNGPGELATWVKPVVRALRSLLSPDPKQVRISLVLSPCANATGQEVALAESYAEIDRVQGASHFFPFLLWGKTEQNWDWRDRGIVIFLGGDQFYPIVIGKRLGYQTVVYAEWEARWHGWVDRFAVMSPEIVDRAKPEHRAKFTIVGDLMAEAGAAVPIPDSPNSQVLIGLLPGSKPGKLAQGVPLFLAAAERLKAARPDLEFVIPVAPTLDVATLTRFADPQHNPVFHLVDGVTAEFVVPPDSASEKTHPFSGSYLKTAGGLPVYLWTQFPAYEVMARFTLCITTVGANTAELGSLAVPMIVVLPTNQLDAMRTWDGIPGILATLPGVGSFFAKIINRLALRNLGLLAWPNIWAKEQIVPELVGYLTPESVAEVALDLLNHAEKLQQMRDRLRSVRGEPGAAQRLAKVVADLIPS
ncbi:MAG: lipid-A-disaccharide synthase [Leptolyngbyaceae cyanobacterium bins.59]|nr:lipid-A-disaccharide synthase [Leptolyngbyaceae cyanobacterium bins.59]